MLFRIQKIKIMTMTIQTKEERDEKKISSEKVDDVEDSHLCSVINLYRDGGRYDNAETVVVVTNS